MEYKLNSLTFQLYFAVGTLHCYLSRSFTLACAAIFSIYSFVVTMITMVTYHEHVTSRVVDIFGRERKRGGGNQILIFVHECSNYLSFYMFSYIHKPIGIITDQYLVRELNSNCIFSLQRQA